MTITAAAQLTGNEVTAGDGARSRAHAKGRRPPRLPRTCTRRTLLRAALTLARSQAIATVLIAVVAKLYQVIQQEVERRNAARDLLNGVSAQINPRFPLLFFKRKFEDGDTLVDVRDRDYDEIMDKNVSYLEGKFLPKMRVELVTFVESLRNATHVAYDILPGIHTVCDLPRAQAQFLKGGR